LRQLQCRLDTETRVVSLQVHYNNKE
jgi:hypothetical protein